MIAVISFSVWIVSFHSIRFDSIRFSFFCGKNKTKRCRHCQTFAETYANIALSFHSSPNEKIRVGRVDCNVERTLMSRFGVRSFPVFYLVDGWSVYEFDNTRRSEVNLMDYARGGYKKDTVGHRRGLSCWLFVVLGGG